MRTVGEIGTREAGGGMRHVIHAQAVLDRNALQVHAENAAAALEVGQADGDRAVEAAWALQSRVERVRPVCRRQYDNRRPRVRLEPVHLCEKLVQGLLALLVGHPGGGGARAR